MIFGDKCPKCGSKDCYAQSRDLRLKHKGRGLIGITIVCRKCKKTTTSYAFVD